MNKYKYDMPIKEWLEYRIHELNKTINMRKKHKKTLKELYGQIEESLIKSTNL